MTQPPKIPVSPPGSVHGSNDLRYQAQALIERAWQLPSHRGRTVLARRALNLSPDCIEAYLLLAEQTRSRAKALVFYQQGVEAGERVLGPEIFRNAVGHFWELPTTRSYLRARAGLAGALWQCGYSEALNHWHALLKLDLHDHLGIRYIVAARLLELEHDHELEAFLQQYKNESSASLTWISALARFRHCGDSIEARRALEVALASNCQVLLYLLGHQPLPRKLPHSSGRGDRNEAIAVAAETLKAWRCTPGALAWLGDHINTWSTWYWS